MPSAKKKKNKPAAVPVTPAPAAEAPLTPPIQLEVTSTGDTQTFPTPGDTVTVHFVGSLAADGSVFDSSRVKGEPFSFTIGQREAVRGWDLGIQRMSLGERAILSIAARVAYGERGCEDKANAQGTGVIPPNADLIFDVELLDINGRRQLSRYLLTLHDWVAAKLARYDTGSDAEAIDAKHGGRGAYEEHLRSIATAKYAAERLKKGPRAPTIMELTEAMAVTATSAVGHVEAAHLPTDFEPRPHEADAHEEGARNGSVLVEAL